MHCYSRGNYMAQILSGLSFAVFECVQESYRDQKGRYVVKSEKVIDYKSAQHSVPNY